MGFIPTRIQRKAPQTGENKLAHSPPKSGLRTGFQTEFSSHRKGTYESRHCMCGVRLKRSHLPPLCRRQPLACGW